MSNCVTNNGSKRSESTGPYGRSWSEKQVHAGNFSLSGFGCSYTPTPRRYPVQVRGEEDPVVRSAILAWTKISQSIFNANALRHIQKAWDSPVTTTFYQKLLSDSCNTPIDATRLRAVASEHQEAGSLLRQSPQLDYACLMKPYEWRWVTVWEALPANPTRVFVVWWWMQNDSAGRVLCVKFVMHS